MRDGVRIYKITTSKCRLLQKRSRRISSREMLEITQSTSQQTASREARVTKEDAQ